MKKNWMLYFAILMGLLVAALGLAYEVVLAGLEGPGGGCTEKECQPVVTPAPWKDCTEEECAGSAIYVPPCSGCMPTPIWNPIMPTPKPNPRCVKIDGMTVCKPPEAKRPAPAPCPSCSVPTPQVPDFPLAWVLKSR